MRSVVAGFAILFCLGSCAGRAEDSSVPKIWFHMGGMGNPNNPAPAKSWDTLFYEPDAQWPEFMDHVQVVGILTQVLGQIPDENLTKVVARLKQKHIALGVEMLAQAYTLPGVDSPPGCGQGVEGYYAPFATAALAAKLKRAGGTLQYIVMDEPLFFGHYYNEKNACHSSIDEVAERVAANVREYEKVFPDVVIGDGEPLPVITSQPNWQSDYRRWLTAFQAKTGKSLAFTDIDINWGHTNWPQSLKSFASFARQIHMPMGIIYNAIPPNKIMTNQEWLDDAQQNFTFIEKTLGVTPNWAVFASWVRFPGRAISDADGLGEDYLVKQYLKLHPMQAAANSDVTTIFEQPELDGVPGNFFVPSSTIENNKYPKSPPFKLIFWQGNPFQANGELVPSTWDAASKTGLDVGDDRDAQYSLRPSGPSSTVQIRGHAVGAYLNSADLFNSRFQADPAMMITPGIDLPNQNIFPFAQPKQKLYQSLKVRIPTAVSQSRPHNTVYVVSDFLFIDRTTGTKLTYEVGLFHQNPHAPPLTREGLIKTEVGLFDAGTHSFQVGSPLSPLARLNEPVEGSALYSTLPWSDERRIAFTISWQNFKTALESLQSKGAYSGSMNPADYVLRQWHLNAEMQYDQTPTELGWSLSNVKIVMLRGNDKYR